MFPQAGRRINSSKAAPPSVTRGALAPPPTCRGRRHDDAAAPDASDISVHQSLHSRVDDGLDLQTSRFLSYLYPEDEERSGVQPACARTHASAMSYYWRDRIVESGQTV